MSTARVIVQPILIAIALAFAVRASSVGIYSIPSPSMEPTLQVGDTIVVTPYVSQQPQSGDVIVFRSAGPHREMMVKRIVATAGDLVEARDGHLFVGGHALGEPYVARDAYTTPIAAQIIPAHSYFVLGDNRGNSYDSRQIGVIDRSAIAGRARLVLWSLPAPAPHAQASPLTPDVAPHTTALRLFRVIR